ncbi:hypothetical protein Dimus_031078 [Dionaea muscipula]
MRSGCTSRRLFEAFGFYSHHFFGEPRWDRKPPMNLTYAFSVDHPADYLSLDEIKEVFWRAFSRWEGVIQVNFTEAEEYWLMEVRIRFYRRDHDNGEPFDGVFVVLAHAFSLKNG